MATESLEGELSKYWESGKADQGERAGVTGGNNMDGFDQLQNLCDQPCRTCRHRGGADGVMLSTDRNPNQRRILFGDSKGIEPCRLIGRQA